MKKHAIHDVWNDADLALLPEISAADVGAEIAKVAKIGQSSSGFTLARPADGRRLVEALRTLFVQNRSTFLRQDAETARSFLDLIAAAEATSVRGYPNIAFSLIVLKAEALLECGDAAAGLNALSDIAERPYLVEGDVTLLVKLLGLRQRALMVVGRRDDLWTVACTDIFIILRTRPLSLGYAFQAFYPALSMREGSAPSPPLPRLLQWLARNQVNLSRESASRIGRRFRNAGSRGIRIIVKALSVFFALMPLRVRNWLISPRVGVRRDIQGVLITRPMGGIGDLIMMTPGLRALSSLARQPVHLAVRKVFFPLFNDNRDVVLHDIEGPILKLQEYGKWTDFGSCPAGRYESSHRPNVRKGRVELFASGMGISKARLDRLGGKPKLNLSAESKIAADAFFVAKGIDAGAPIVAVHAFSRDTYKDYRHMVPLIEQLARSHKVLVFHHVSFPLPQHENIIPAFGQPLAEALATFAKCTVAVCVDSAFLHVAAALDMPTVALFGPTDGETFTKHHPKVHVIALRKAFGCMPCWRNEDEVCKMTNSRESPCLNAIDVNSVVASVEAALEKYQSQIGNAT